ncbi:MAG: hypothetical protein ACLRFP_04955 [Alphaproteobacteria bacterium]
MSYKIIFDQLNNARQISTPDAQMDLFATPSNTPNMAPTEFWYVSDLHNILGENVIPEKLISGREIFSYIFTPHDFNGKKFPELDAYKKHEFRKTHIDDIHHEFTVGYHKYKNATDYLASRYAAASFIKKSMATHDAVFAYAYFLHGTISDKPNFNEICNISDEILRISSRENVAKYEKQLAGIIKQLGQKHSSFQNRTAPYFFGRTPKEVKARYGISEKQPLNDYLHHTVLDARAIAIESAIARYNRNQYKNNEIFQNFVCDALRNARNELFNKTGRTPELSVTRTSVPRAKTKLQKLETEFVKKFSTQNIR